MVLWYYGSKSCCIYFSQNMKNLEKYEIDKNMFLNCRKMNKDERWKWRIDENEELMKIGRYKYVRISIDCWLNIWAHLVFIVAQFDTELYILREKLNLLRVYCASFQFLIQKEKEINASILKGLKVKFAI